MNNLTKNNFHITVLKTQAVDALEIKKDAWYIDCTLGGAGHTLEILKKGGKVLGIDQDQDALDEAKSKLKDFPSDNYILVKDNFKNIKNIALTNQVKPVGVLFDLGVSNFQLSGNQRGFSFQKDEPLDMRMDPQNQTVTAKDLVNGMYENELEKLIKTYGEDKLARSIAKAIVYARRKKPIETTGELRQIIEHIYSRVYSTKSKINPATKTFQALRILVNDEIDSLKNALDQTIQVLEKNGKIVVISFHSLEDHLVKNTFRSWQDQNLGEIETKKPINPTDFEIELNPQSRSAKLRIFKKN